MPTIPKAPPSGFFARKWRRLIQYYGPAPIKQRQWDREFKQGLWECLTNTSGDPLYPILERYARDGSLLDLGCGSGNTANEMREGSYQSYLGIDISEEALRMARLRTQTNGRAHNTRFAQSEISAYVPDRKYRVIVFRDSIYYEPPFTLRKTLERYAAYLDDNGVLVVRLAEGMKSLHKIEQIIADNFRVLERRHSIKPAATIVVFR